MKKYTSLLTIISIAMLAMVSMIPSGYSAEVGPKIDILRQMVISSPDAALIAMQTDVADVYPDLIRTADIQKLHSEGFTITQDMGFHMGFIGYNIRDLADPAVNYGYRPELIGSFWPLSDVDFRHALIHCYDQLGIIPPIYG